ncbi:MAG: hypothetical protein J0I93_01105 [Legionella sp.]|nr:hypothetical protein [Legionella sp.]
MDTNEHTQLGNSVRINNWQKLKNNNYVHFDNNGTLSITMQRLDDDGMPVPLNLKMTAGQVCGMSGDYYGGNEVSLNLPTHKEFDESDEYDKYQQKLGKYLTSKPINDEEMDKLLDSYRRLANPQTTIKEIETIYKINNARYIPFSETLNFYVQQLMFATRVRNYGDMLTRNMSHFTPWSIRAYAISHFLALRYARLAYHLEQWSLDPNYHSENDEFLRIRDTLKPFPAKTTPTQLQDLSHRYTALSLGIEFFGFHYYTDHFAAGHGSFIGDLRVELPKRFGLWGSILVNSLHDEENKFSVNTVKPYDPTPDPKDAPIQAYGDGSFDLPANHYNKNACLNGMHASLNDIQKALQGEQTPNPAHYSGYEHMPDIDYNYRQHTPLILLGNDNKIYFRQELSTLKIVSPSLLEKIYQAPHEYGYQELSSKAQALWLVMRLRVLPLSYKPKIQSLSAPELDDIVTDEKRRIPGRQPQETPLLAPTTGVALKDWKKPLVTRPELVSHSIFRPDNHPEEALLEQDLQPAL